MPRADLAALVAGIRWVTRVLPITLGTLLTQLGCAGEAAPCARCGTLVIAAIGEPDDLVPPLVWQSVGRDIQDLVYERLAVLDPAGAPTDPAAYHPALAVRWERVDSVTLRFRLRPGARWQDGTPVRAEDVVFSFEAHQDPALDAVALGSIEGIRAEAEDSETVRLTFAESRPDQLYDATYHVRIFPRHVWDTIPHERWGGRDPSLLIGSGPYRVAEWKRGEFLILEAMASTTPSIRRVVWRFAKGPDAAANMMLAGEADLLETVPDPARFPEFERQEQLRLVAYPSAVYGFLGFNLARRGPWSDLAVRHALRLGSYREELVRAVFGPGAVVPRGPMSAQLWLWESGAEASGDSAGAVKLLDEAGWVRGTGVRTRRGVPLRMDLLVPASSETRRRLAVTLQERWARLGVTVTITAVDFPVFQERLQAGKFDAYIGAWLDEPHPRSLADQWTRHGIGKQNYGRYANPAFDSLFAAAMISPDPERTRRLWREALDTLDADQPAIWLYTPTNMAVVRDRLDVDHFPAFSWLAQLPAWRLRDP